MSQLPWATHAFTSSQSAQSAFLPQGPDLSCTKGTQSGGLRLALPQLIYPVCVPSDYNEWGCFHAWAGSGWRERLGVTSMDSTQATGKQNNSGRTPAASPPSSCRLLHTLGPCRWRQIPAYWLGFAIWLPPSSSLTTGKKISLIVMRSLLDNIYNLAQPASLRIFKWMLPYNPFIKVALVVLC